MTDTTESHDSTADDGQTRRRFLTAATSAVGVGGVAGVAVPFWVLGTPQKRPKRPERRSEQTSVSWTRGRWSLSNGAANPFMF